MSALDIPGDLIITVHPRPERGETVPAQINGERVREIPTTLTGIWDGPDTPGQYPEPPFIMLDIPWYPGFAGYGYEDICRMIARVAAYLAADGGGWPTTEAHVRGLPVVDTRFSFIVAPATIPPAPARSDSLMEFTANLAAELDAVDPEGAARLRQFLEPGCKCECGRCCCGETG